MEPFTFFQVADNAKIRAVADTLNNTTTPITLNGVDIGTFGEVEVGYIVTIWDDETYPDPFDDPQMEKAAITAIDGEDVTLTRVNAKTHAGTPLIANLLVAQNITMIHEAINGHVHHRIASAGTEVDLNKSVELFGNGIVFFNNIGDENPFVQLVAPEGMAFYANTGEDGGGLWNAGLVIDTDGTFRVISVVPTNPTDIPTSDSGAIAFDDDYMYIKTSTSWKRIPLESWSE